MKIASFIFFLISLAFTGLAQDFNIKKVEQVGDKINLYYDLLDSTDVTRRTYTIALYSSRDSYTTPLTKVSGDIGQTVRPGGNKKITWNAKEELGAEFNGKVGLEVRGKLFIPFLRLEGFGDKKIRKRGVKEDVTWSGGRANSLINFELYKKGKFIAAPKTNIAVSLGKQDIVIPENVKPGSGYQFKIADSKDKEEYILTDEFQVRRRFPLGLKIIPVIGVGALIYFLTRTESDNDIPDPLDIGIATGKN